MSRKLLLEILSLLETFEEEIPSSVAIGKRIEDTIDAIKVEVGWVAPVDIYKPMKQAQCDGRLDNDIYLPMLARDIASKLNTR